MLIREPAWVTGLHHSRHHQRKHHHSARRLHHQNTTGVTVGRLTRTCQCMLTHRQLRSVARAAIRTIHTISCQVLLTIHIGCVVGHHPLYREAQRASNRPHQQEVLHLELIAQVHPNNVAAHRSATYVYVRLEVCDVVCRVTLIYALYRFSLSDFDTCSCT